MAVTLKPLYPTIREAKERRLELLRYLRLEGGRRLIAAALLLALMSGLNLAQTGRWRRKGTLSLSYSDSKPHSCASAATSSYVWRAPNRSPTSSAAPLVSTCIR